MYGFERVPKAEKEEAEAILITMGFLWDVVGPKAMEETCFLLLYQNTDIHHSSWSRL